MGQFNKVGLAGRLQPSAFLHPFSPEFHPDEASRDRPHLEGGQGAGDDINSVLSNRCKNGFKVFLRMDQRIGGSQLRKEVGVRVSYEGDPSRFRNLDGLYVEVNAHGIEVAVFDGVKKFDVLEKKPVQTMGAREIGVWSDDQSFRTAMSCEGSKISPGFAGSGVQDEDMTPPDRDLDTRDEENSPVLCKRGEILTEGHLVVISDGENIKTLVGRL